MQKHLPVMRTYAKGNSSAMKIKTWAEHSTFEYSGCVLTGTEITFGNDQTVTITTAQWMLLRAQFLGKISNVGTSRDNPPIGSMGEWFKTHIRNQALTSYVAVILVREGYAIKEDEHNIRIIR